MSFCSRVMTSRGLLSKPKLSRLAVPSILFFFGALYILIPVLNHYFLRSYSYDYGVYNQAFYDYAHFRVNRNTVMEPPLHDFMQIHVAYILYLMTPFYWLIGWFAGTYTLLIAQALVMTAGGYGVYLLVKERAGEKWMALLAMVHYFILVGHFSALAADYIDTTVGASLAPFFLLFFFREKFFPASFFFLAVLLTKENMALWLAFISLALIVLQRRSRAGRRAGFAYLAVSVIYFIFIYPALVKFYEHPSYSYNAFAFSALGNNMTEALGFLLSHPKEAIEYLFVNHTGDPDGNGVKAEFYCVMLGSGAILLLRKPVYLLFFLPIVAQKMYNDFTVRWGIISFYSVEVVSVLSFCVFRCIAAFRDKRARIALVAAVMVGTLVTTIVKLDHRRAWYDPGKENVLSEKFYSGPHNLDDIYAALELIPGDAAVSASERLVPHLAFREKIYCFPNVHDADYIVLLPASSTYPLCYAEYLEAEKQYLGNPEWKTLFQKDGMTILERQQAADSRRSAKLAGKSVVRSAVGHQSAHAP